MRLLCLLAAAAACGSNPYSSPNRPPGDRRPPARSPVDALVAIPGATFTMGDPKGEPNEAPRRVTVEPFEIMRHEVTNDQFARFVGETGHVTDPERRGFGHVWPGEWKRARGADWRHPYGPQSSIANRGDHPVVQVSWQDARAFCQHYGMRLPTEAEWQLAAGGPDNSRYPWGDRGPRSGPVPLANSGTMKCCAADASDGHLKTAPVGSYPAGRSPYGLDDMAGNVWEWTADRFPGDSSEVTLHGGGWGNDDYGLRISYVHGNPPNRGLDMVGVRCAR